MAGKGWTEERRARARALWTEEKRAAMSEYQTRRWTPARRAQAARRVTPQQREVLRQKGRETYARQNPERARWWRWWWSQEPTWTASWPPSCDACGGRMHPVLDWAINPNPEPGDTSLITGWKCYRNHEFEE